jgi:hypothetical protein
MTAEAAAATGYQPNAWERMWSGLQRQLLSPTTTRERRGCVAGGIGRAIERSVIIFRLIPVIERRRLLAK